MDLVKITCYRQTKIMERVEAIRFYREGVNACEGSERDRYMNILLGLIDGLKEVSDEG